MRFFKLPVVVLLVLSFAVASQSRANSVPIRGGSTYGDNTGFNTCVANITDFLSTNVANNCEGFIPTTFTIEGVTYSGAVFAFLEPNGTGFGILDIILLSGNSSLTLSLVNPLLPTGVFMCGSFGDPSNPTVVQDSTPTPMPGLPCTPGSSPSLYGGTLDLANVQANFSATGVTFVNGNSTGLAVFTEHGNIATPEPGSLMLLGVGLLAVGRKFRRTS
jgi:hypothetical protein